MKAAFLIIFGFLTLLFIAKLDRRTDVYQKIKEDEINIEQQQISLDRQKLLADECKHGGTFKGEVIVCFDNK